MKRVLGCLAVLFVTLAYQGANSAPPAPVLQKAADTPETVMLFAHQPDDPVRITQATFSADNTLLDAQLENQSHQKIQSYRLGWAAVRKEDVRIAKSNSIDVPSGVDTTKPFTIPGPENAAKDEVAKHPPAIVFYVAELQFEDGKHWQADLKKIRKEAIELGK